MVKLLHWIALRISDLGEYLFDRGGALECWCDERIERQNWVEWREPDEVANKAWLAVLPHKEGAE